MAFPELWNHGNNPELWTSINFQATESLRISEPYKEYLYTKVNNQLVNVISRFRKIVPTAVKCNCYKAFRIPQNRYCSTVWHFCGARNRDKLETPNKRVLRIVFNEKSLYWMKSSDLYSRDHKPLRHDDYSFQGNPFGHDAKILVVCFKWKTNKLVVPFVNTTTHGLK